MKQGFTSEWQTKDAIKEMVEIQKEHSFPLMQYTLVLGAALLLWYLFKNRVYLYNILFPPEKRELRRAHKKLESWRQDPPKTLEDYSARYSEMVSLLKKKLHIARSVNYQDLQRQKGFEALAKRAEFILFAKQTPEFKEYETDLESVASLFQL